MWDQVEQCRQSLNLLTNDPEVIALVLRTAQHSADRDGFTSGTFRTAREGEDLWVAQEWEDEVLSFFAEWTPEEV